MSGLVKICGLRDPGNIREVFRLKPDLAGFIFYPPSPRFAGPPEIFSFLNELEEKPLITGVFVNPEVQQINRTLEVLKLDFVQLHGHETPELCEEIRDMGLRVIKAFGIQTADDFSKTSDYAACADYFLFDTKSSAFGGTGTSFDWTLLDQYEGKTSWFLSGGLAAGSRLPAGYTGMAGVDLNSRFEISPGIKDTSLLQQFITAYRNG